MTRNWWADRLAEGTTPARRSTNPLLTPVTQAPPQAPPKPPPSAKVEEYCPGCGSGNYMASPGTTYMRCYDCGWPIQQSGTGVGNVKADAPTKQAKQVSGNGYHPNTIIGRVG